MRRREDKAADRVVINALQYKKNSSGIGVMLRELFSCYTRQTESPCQILLSQDSPELPVGKSTEIVRASCTYQQGLRRMWFQTVELGRRYCRNAILITNDSKVPFFLPKSCRLVPIITDLAVYRMPEVYQRSRVLWWKLQYQYLKRRADLVITISEFSKKEIVELLKIPAEKIKVVPCASALECKPLSREDRESFQKRWNLPERYILFVGNSNPRKNLQRLLKAFDLARESGLECDLVIAGEQGWKFDREKTMEEIKCAEAVHWLGYVPDKDMPYLYEAAELFAFPSLYEGFGIPVLEAQSRGTPVLTSNSSSLPEVGGDGAVYVDPYREEDICRGILKVTRNGELARELAEKGKRNVLRFSWQTSAELLDTLLKEEFA